MTSAKRQCFHPSSNWTTTGPQNQHPLDDPLTTGGAREDAQRVTVVHGPHLEAAGHKVGEHHVEVTLGEAGREVVELDDVRGQGGVGGRLVIGLRLAAAPATHAATTRLTSIGGAAGCLRNKAGLLSFSNYRHYEMTRPAR